jgi:hypothetical protein
VPQLRYDSRALRKSIHIALAIACAAAVAAGCGRKQENAPAVATPSLSLDKDRVPIGSAVTLTYKFVVAPDAKIAKDYTVFVHVLDPEGEQMWTDDHTPPTPTSQWKPGQTVQYQRTVFVPNYPFIGEATVRLGMYDRATGERLALNASEASRREYVVARFQIVASSENVVLIPKGGWHQNENDSKDPTSEWQWTMKTATLSFKNPKKDATFYMQYDARPDLFNAPQQVTLRIGDQTIGQFAADAKNPALETFHISAAQFGSSDMDDLVVDVDRTFKPGGDDPRELGIRIYHTYLDPK